MYTNFFMVIPSYGVLFSQIPAIIWFASALIDLTILADIARRMFYSSSRTVEPTFFSSNYKLCSYLLGVVVL